MSLTMLPCRHNIKWILISMDNPLFYLLPILKHNSAFKRTLDFMKKMLKAVNLLHLIGVFLLLCSTYIKGQQYTDLEYSNIKPRLPAIIKHSDVELGPDYQHSQQYIPESIKDTLPSKVCSGNPSEKFSCAKEYLQSVISFLTASEETCFDFANKGGAYPFNPPRNGYNPPHGEWKNYSCTFAYKIDPDAGTNSDTRPLSEANLDEFCISYSWNSTDSVMRDLKCQLKIVVEVEADAYYLNDGSFIYTSRGTAFNTSHNLFQFYFSLWISVFGPDNDQIDKQCPPDGADNDTLFEVFTLPDNYGLAIESGYTVDLNSDWSYLGDCMTEEDRIHHIIGANDYIKELIDNINSGAFDELNVVGEEYICNKDWVECNQNPVPERFGNSLKIDKSNGPWTYTRIPNEFYNILASIDVSEYEVSGNIPESFYFFVDSLLSYNSNFTWNLGVVNPESNPLPSEVITDYPLLLAKLKADPSLVTSFGDKVCYPDTPEFSAAFAGLDWLKYACNTESESCPVENTGPECLEGNPINARTGVKIESATDYSASGKSPLRVKRSYSSSKDDSRRGWQFNIVEKALRISGDYVKLTGRSKSNYLFTCSNTAPSSCGVKKLRGQENYYFGYKLSKLVDGYSLTLASGAVELYNLSGQLTLITSSQGSKLTYSYQANNITVTDEFNQQITLTTNNDNLVTQATTPVGTFSYNYDEFNRLITVTKPDSTTIGYRYDEATHSTVQYYQSSTQTCAGDDYLTVRDCKTLVKDLGLLTGKIDENGQRYASWYYDDKQRAYKSEHGTGIDATTINFISEEGEAGTNGSGEAISLPRVRETISPLGLRTRTTFRSPSAQRAEKVEVFDVSNNLISTESYSYDSYGYEASYIDVNGLNTQYTRYNDGREYRRVENSGTADARTISTSYSGSTNKPTQITTPETRINISYITHNSGLLVSQQTTTDLSIYKQRITKFTYNTQGQLETINGPRTDVIDVTTFAYNAQGLRNKTTNALGHITQVTEFNAFGKPVTLIDENNTTTTLSYDLMGRLTSMQRAGTTTTFDYDLTGNLVKTIRANGSVLEYEYDVAKRLTAIKDAAGNRIEYSLDAAGNQLSTQVKGNTGTLLQAQQQFFDEFSRLVSITNATSNSTQFDYLANGNLDKTTDALNNPTNNGYDNLQRLAEIHDAENGTTTFGYDNAGRTTSITDATGKATTYTYNGFGELIKQVSPDSGETSFTYDEAGNLASETDARNITVTYQYDALNRLILTAYPDSTENISFSYDDTTNPIGPENKGIGRLTRVDEAAGQRRYVYGELGQLLSETYNIGMKLYSINYQYDSAGQLTGMTYPSGRTLTYALNTDGQITAITTLGSGQNQTSQSLVSNASYLPFGPLSGFSYGNGLVNSYNYDQNYRLTDHTLTGLKNETLSYSAISNIDAISDSLNSNNNVTFGYDKLSRLLTSADNNNTDTNGDFSFTYDAIGNRQSKLNNNITENYTYLANTHHLEKVTINKLVQVPSFDSSFNQARRMASTTYNGVTTQYQYNYRELRVSKTTTANSDVAIHYHYDANGLLIAESDGNGVWLKEYVYFNGQLIAMVDFDNGIAQPVYAVHTDHLGTPTQITNTTGALVWQASFSPFGLATINNDVDGDLVDGKSTPVELNIRFPGQYYDVETGLHYNWHRYYDPSVGRYITSDPLGLAAGISTYGYVGGNPISSFDPDGLISANGQGDARFNEVIRRLQRAAREEFEKRMQQMLANGCAGKGHNLSLSETEWWWRNAGGQELRVDGSALTIDNWMSTISGLSIVGPSLFDDVRVHGQGTLDSSGHIINGPYDFNSQSWGMNPIRWLRNILTPIAEWQHGDGTEFNIVYDYDNEGCLCD